MAKPALVRQSLKDQITEILIERMVKGVLVPGDRIKELQIANEFGTSQAPVREAIKCLETLGYVEHVPHNGAKVKIYSKQEVEEAFQVREALEVHAMSLIGTQVEKLIRDLNIQLSEMKRATKSGNVRQFIKADNLFHRAIVCFSNNETMLSVWDSLKMQMQAIATIVKASIPLGEIYELHPPIVKALKNKINEDASQLLHGHYTRASSYWRNKQ